MVVVVEHDLDVVAAADCVIDLGPEGAPVVAWGPLEVAWEADDSYTAAYLDEHLRRRAGAGRSGAGRRRLVPSHGRESVNDHDRRRIGHGPAGGPCA